MNKLHDLKCHPDEFDAITKQCVKRFEFRKNDRDFKVGDSLYLRRYNPDLKFYYHGQTFTVRVTHITYGPNFGIPEGYCIMSIKY